MKNIHVLPTVKPSRLHLWTDERGTRLQLCDLKYSHTRNTQSIYITSDEEIKEGNYIICWEDNYENIEIIKIGKSNYTHWLIDAENYKKIILTTDQELIKDGVQAIDDEFLEWFVKNPSCEKVEVYEVGGKLFAEPIIPQQELKSTNCGNKNCQGGVINGLNPKLCKKCNPQEEPKLIKCYCGHTTYCDCGPLEEPKQDYVGVHLRHCYQGEYEDSCKYGEDNCPANPKEQPKQETLEEAAESRYGTDMDSIRGSNVYDLNTDLKRGFVEGAKWQAERMYTEKQMDDAYDKGIKDATERMYSKEDLEVAYFEGREGLYSFNDWFAQFKKK